MTTLEIALKELFVSHCEKTPAPYQFELEPQDGDAFGVLLNDCRLNISFGKAWYVPRGMAATLWTSEIPHLMSFYTMCPSPLAESIKTCKWVATHDTPIETGILTLEMISQLIEGLVKAASKTTSTASTLMIRPVKILEPVFQRMEYIALMEENRDKLFITIPY